MDFKSNTKIAQYFQLSFGKFFLFLVLIIVTIFPSTTQAGIWSSVTDIFSSQAVSAQSEVVIESNSQNMSLPEPANNFEPTAKFAASIVIDGGDALLPQVGLSNNAVQNKVDNSNGQISLYIVRSGDTLAEIAEMFDVSISTILWANDMTKNSVLKIGQTLVILPMSGVMHTVVKGDTLSSIAKKYGGDVSEISSFNNFKVTDKLSIGDTIMIPDGQVSSSIRPSTASSKLISSSGGPAYDGYYQKPFIGGHKTQGLHGYNGVDYGMPIGTPLYASAAGTVIISKNSGWNGGYGNYVVIQHPNSTQTVYGHMSGVSVSVGQKVNQGQTIGSSGNTGKSTGPHLHFEIRGAKNPF
jgi:LysM repeat protein